MKPYAKTFRVSKLHKACNCGLCAERVHHSKKKIRQQAKAEIEQEQRGKHEQ